MLAFCFPFYQVLPSLFPGEEEEVKSHEPRILLQELSSPCQGLVPAPPALGTLARGSLCPVCGLGHPWNGVYPHGSSSMFCIPGCFQIPKGGPLCVLFQTGLWTSKGVNEGTRVATRFPGIQVAPDFPWLSFSLLRVHCLLSAERTRLWDGGRKGGKSSAF